MIRKISERQFYQLLGLITVGQHYTRLNDALQKTFADIAGKEAGERFWDYLYETDLERSLREHLPYDEVEIKTTHKQPKTDAVK